LENRSRTTKARIGDRSIWPRGGSRPRNRLRYGSTTVLYDGEAGEKEKRVEWLVN